jgi:hypothetical protein
VTGWLRRHPLAAFLPLQALIYCSNLGLLSPWDDEAGTLLAMRRSLQALLQFAANDVHPPLYYLLLYSWLKIPLGLDWAVQARLLSVAFALLGTVALDRFWGEYFERSTRITLLALWTLSPCLMLYARMCRSYSLQALFAIIGTALVLRVIAKPQRHNAVLLALVLLGSLYTHYAAGIALIAAANLLLAHRPRWRMALALDCAVLMGYLPWIWRLAASLANWGTNTRNYTLSGSRLFEVPVKLAYWCMSFVMGEAVPDALLVLGALLLPLVAWVVWRGARRWPELARLSAALAIIGFIAAARWVSYPFIPARLLFVLPFFLMLVASGAATVRWGKALVGAMLLLSVSGVWCYFAGTGFRNKQYPMPMRQIAAEIVRDSRPGESAILVDATNSDPVALTYALSSQRSVLLTADPRTPAELTRLLADPHLGTVWFLRNTHDVSPQGLNSLFLTQLREHMRETVHSYEPYTPLERALMPGPQPPRYFHELVEFRRR